VRLQTSNCSLLLIYPPQKDDRLSRPDWLTYSRRFTHISGHPSAAGQVERRTGKVCQSKTDVLPLCHATNQLVRVYLYFPSSCGHKYYTTTIRVWCEYSTTTITITIRLRHEAMTTNWHVNFFDFLYSIVACCSELVASSCRNRVIVVTYFFPSHCSWLEHSSWNGRQGLFPWGIQGYDSRITQFVFWYSTTTGVGSCAPISFSFSRFSCLVLLHL